MIFSKIENLQIIETRSTGNPYLSRPSIEIDGQSTTTPNTEQNFRDAGWYEYIPPIVGENQIQLATTIIDLSAKTYTHEVRDKTQEELDAEAQAEADATELENETAGSPLTGVTFSQAEAYIEDNVTDLASAKAALKKLAKALLILNRHLNI